PEQARSASATCRASPHLRAFIAWRPAKARCEVPRRPAASDECYSYAAYRAEQHVLDRNRTRLQPWLQVLRDAPNNQRRHATSLAGEDLLTDPSRGAQSWLSGCRG